jgi:phage-related tail protein
VAQADRLLDAGVITLDTYNQHINQLGKELNDVQFENIKKGINDISGAVANAIVNGNDLGEAFNNIVKKMAADLIQSGLQRLINGLFDGATGGGGGGGGGLFKFIGSFFANGTPSAPGGLAMVGERGPELVNLAKGSRVHTANDTRSMLRGANQNVHITLHAPAGFTAEQMSQIQGVSVRVVESSIASNNRTQSDQRYLRGG